MQGVGKALWFATVRLLGAVAVGVAGGWFFGNAWAGLSVALAAYLVWQFVNLYRFDWWVRHRSFADPPEFGGMWGEVVMQVVRLHRRKRYHKQRFVKLVRQIQRSTAALPDGVVILNEHREITWFNRTAERLLDLRGAEDHGVRIDNLLRQPHFARYFDGGEYANAVVLQPDARLDRYLSVQLVPYGEGGQHLLLVRDVSRQMRLENMRKDFVANASHELRSPLSVIAGYLETLSLDSALPEDMQEPVAEMRRQATRMTTIIQDLLALSKLEGSGELVGGAVIDVPALLALLRKDVLARGMHPREVRIKVESLAMLRGDEAEIHSAFSNLVDNAAKYTPQSGSIEMRWWVDGEGGHFAVTDTGMGIPAEHIPRLTERFYRVDGGRSRLSGGSGLGLAIVKHVLERHDATLEIQSTLDVGSTFICHFPPQRVVEAAAESRATG